MDCKLSMHHFSFPKGILLLLLQELEVRWSSYSRIFASQKKCRVKVANPHLAAYLLGFTLHFLSLGMESWWLTSLGFLIVGVKQEIKWMTILSSIGIVVGFATYYLDVLEAGMIENEITDLGDENTIKISRYLFIFLPIYWKTYRMIDFESFRSVYHMGNCQLSV